MKTYNHKMTGFNVRDIMRAEARHARRVDGWHAWSKVLELSALVGALLAIVFALELLR